MSEYFSLYSYYCPSQKKKKKKKAVVSNPVLSLNICKSPISIHNATIWNASHHDQLFSPQHQWRKASQRVRRLLRKLLRRSHERGKDGRSEEIRRPQASENAISGLFSTREKSLAEKTNKDLTKEGHQTNLSTGKKRRWWRSSSRLCQWIQPMSVFGQKNTASVSSLENWMTIQKRSQMRSGTGCRR